MLVPVSLLALLALRPTDAPKEIYPGAPAPAIEVKSWLKGKPVIELESGKTYVVEFWATWCGPCIESIPHITELAKKMGDKVTFIGVSIWEGKDATREKVQQFVDKMGAKMDYNIAMGGDKDGMAESWMKAASRNGIPSAFIVKDKQIQWVGHPMSMEQPLQQVVNGTFDLAASKKSFDKEAAETKAQMASQEQIRAAMALYDAGKKPEARAALKTFAKKSKDNAEQAQAVQLGWDAQDDPKKAERTLEKLAKSGKEPELMQVCSFALGQAGPKSKAPELGLKAMKLALEHGKKNVIVQYYGVNFYQRRGDAQGTLDCANLALELLPTSELKSNEGFAKFLTEAKAKAEATLKTKSN